MKDDNRFLPFALPDIGEGEISEVAEALRSGWVTTGPRTREFEEAFAVFVGGGVEALAVNSATAGLHLALEAVGVKAGDEVIVPTYTFTATAEVVRYLGADPVFVDCEPGGFNLDAAGVAAAVTERTRAIVPVHFGGQACAMEPLLALAPERRLRVVEDAAHALPTHHHGRLVGSLDSDATVFSFYATKTITTGEGGMVVTRDPAIAKRCRVMRLHGIDRDAFDRYTSQRPSWSYEVVAPGFKYNMTDVAAAVGLCQLEKARRFHERRLAIARRYDESFADLPLLLPPRPELMESHAWHLYVIRLLPEAPLGRDAFIQEMARRGIGTSVHFIPLHRHPYWRDTYGLGPERFPNAEAAFQGAVSLPIYTRMTDEDVGRVIAAVRGILGA
ncbi:MAG: DegT/DnrJ/EryC1/StrS family aminotransferase [Acidobacteriota bacterium]